MTVVEAPTPTEAPAKSRQEILLDAAALIEEHGWTRGGSGMPGNEDHIGMFCILGAVAYAMGYRRNDYESSYIDAGYIVGCPDPDDAWEWNDEHNPGYGRKVVLALRRLADGATWEEAIA